MKPPTSSLDARPRVLLAEDNPTTRKIMSHWLESHGYTVVQAEDGSKAWSSAQRDCPPIVVTDWNMPRMSGIELCRSIRQKHESDQVYLLVATSRDEGEDITEAMKAGANDFLSKPVREDELLARIRNAENALQQLRHRSELADLDSLTGLFNRRAFLLRGDKLIQQAKENRTRLACLILDVDLFKRYNDDFGHAMGDQVLHAVADCIKQETRDSDLACRLGGDEFCVLIPGVSEEDAFEIAERIRQQVGCHTCETSRNDAPIKATLGVAAWHDKMLDINELIAAADRVLLRAKVDGRNRTGCSKHAQNTNSKPRRNPLNQALGISGEINTGELTVNAICQSPVISMFEGESLEMARSVLVSNHIDCIMVVNDTSELVGVLTERELLVASVNGVEAETPVKEIMSFNFVIYTEEMPVRKFWESYQRNPNLRSIVVDYFNRPVGLIRGKRLLALFQHRTNEAN